LLAFSAVHRQLHDMTVGAEESFVAVEQGLNVIGAGRYVLESLNGITEDRGINSDRLSWPQCFSIDTEDLDGVRTGPDLEPRLIVVMCGQHEDDPTVDRLRCDLR